MAEQDNDPDKRQASGSSLFRYRTHHLLYITMAVSAVLGVPGLMIAAVLVFGPWLLLGPLILAQFLFILLIPPLRRKLLGPSEE